jgi:flagellar transcriptional activator FlhD
MAACDPINGGLACLRRRNSYGAATYSGPRLGAIRIQDAAVLVDTVNRSPTSNGASMQLDDRLMAEVRDANLSYLILAQRLIRADRVQALYRLGVSEEVADILEGLSPSQLMKIAASNMLMCRFRFDDEMVWSLLTDHGRAQGEGAEGNAARLHASILMAGNVSEAIDS